MAQASVRPPTNRPPKAHHSDGDGNRIHNEILVQLSPDECEVVLPKLEFMRLNTHHLLHEAGDTLKSAYFVNSGMVSVLSVFPDGKSVEVGLIGKEGFIGLPLIAGFHTAATRAVVQVESTVFRLEANALLAILAQCPTLHQKLQQFSLLFAAQVTQIAACNQLHDVQERLTRWLLMSTDRVGLTSLPLTQELLSQMLGTRRSSVTVAAGILQKAGLIRYTRGVLDVVDKGKLEEASCDCYRLMEQQAQAWTNSAR